jgi:hypothetical protein
MHALLALSAAHLRYSKREEHEKYATYAAYHQNFALRYFRTAILDITKENCAAIFSAAALFSLITMASISHPVEAASEDSVTSLDDILALVVLTRGVRDILEPVKAWIQLTPLANMIHGYKLLDYAACVLPEEAQLQLTKLHEMVTSSTAQSPSAHACADAMAHLEKSFKDRIFLINIGEPETGGVMRWMTEISSDFFSLLRSRDVTAMIIFAHYVILVQNLETRWVSSNQGFKVYLLRMYCTARLPVGTTWLHCNQARYAA